MQLYSHNVRHNDHYYNDEYLRPLCLNLSIKGNGSEAVRRHPYKLASGWRGPPELLREHIRVGTHVMNEECRT